MPLVARLALRNLLRNRRRTILTAIVMVAAVGILVLGESVISGLEENVIVAAESGLIGHVQARPAGYPPEGFQHPVDQLLEVGPAARALLDRESAAWTERILFSPLASTGRDAIRVRAIGYDPERDEKVFPRTLWRVQGRLPVADGDEVAVARGVAKLLGLSVGDQLVLQVRTHRGALNALEVRVSALVVTNNTSIDSLGVLAPKALAQRLIAANQPSHLCVRLHERAQAEAFRGQLAAALGPRAEVVTWLDETRELLRLQQIRRKALDILVVILLALAGFGMANTILMAAHERVQEVGTLRSMGMTEAAVLGLFLLEGGLLGLLSSLLGAAWGGGLASWWSRHPIDMTATLEKNVAGELSLSAFIYTRFDASVAAIAIGFGFTVALVASVYPARFASRLAPADAVRAET